MSLATSSQASEGYWELVHCGVCYQSFFTSGNPQNIPPLPFWVTDCGHVICNNHLKHDQTCAVCGRAGYTVAPLQQRGLPQPMDRWFQSIPQALEGLYSTARMQHEGTLQLVRHYRNKCSRYKHLVEKMKSSLDEMQGLKEQVEKLRKENGRLRGDSKDPLGDMTNNSERSGKRRRLDNEGRRSSSAHSNALVHPVRPERLTLPAESVNQQPIYPSGAGSETHSIGPTRPSSALYQTFAYQPPEQTDTIYPQPLSHMQTAHRQSDLHARSSIVRQVMGPPPTPTPATGRPHYPEVQSRTVQGMHQGNLGADQSFGHHGQRLSNSTTAPTGSAMPNGSMYTRDSNFTPSGMVSAQNSDYIGHPSPQAYYGSGNPLYAPNPTVPNHLPLAEPNVIPHNKRFLPAATNRLQNTTPFPTQAQTGRFRPASAVPSSSQHQRFVPQRVSTAFGTR